MLQPSQAGQLLTLVRVEPDREVVVARSYDGHPWEGPTLADPLMTECAPGQCHVTLPPAAPGVPTAYELRQVDVSAEARAAAAPDRRSARLLLQATFGPSSDAIAEHLALSPDGSRAAWIAAQMALPATLLRRHLRAGSNQYWAPSGGQAGGFRGPCEAGSEWIPYTLTPDGSGLHIEVGTDGLLRFERLLPLTPRDVADATPGVSGRVAGDLFKRTLYTAVAPAYVIVDIGAKTELTQVRVHQSNFMQDRFPRSIAVQTSAANATGPWLQAGSALLATVPASFAVVTIDIPAGMGAMRFVKLVFDLSENNLVQAVEVQIFAWGPMRSATIAPLLPSGTYTVCSVTEGVGQPVALAAAGEPCPGRWSMSNPAVDPAAHALVGGSDASAVFTEQDADFAGIAGGFPGADQGHRVLRSISRLDIANDRVLCGERGAEMTATLRFAQWAGTWYQYDRRKRMRYLENDVGSPFMGPPPEGARCPAVRRTPFNEHMCVRAPACNAAVDVDSSKRTLDEATMRAFWTRTGHPVYHVAQLTLADPHYDGAAARTPCTGASRWLPLGGACGSGGRPAATAFGAGGTAAALAAALAGSPDAGVNPWLRDVDLGAVDPVATCGGSAADVEAARSAHVESGGECWQHVHPDTLSVFDFSLWTSAAGHPGGGPAILKWAQDGGVTLVYPHQDAAGGVVGHDMARWEEYAGRSILRIGRMGDQLRRAAPVAARWRGGRLVGPQRAGRRDAHRLRLPR